MGEKTIESNLVRGIKRRGGICIKFPAMYISGFPDRMVLMPGGLIWFVELKLERKKPTVLQDSVHKLLRGLGFDVFVLAGKAEVANFLNMVDIVSKENLI